MKKSIGISLVFLLLLGTTLSIQASEDQLKNPELRKELVKLKYIQARQVQPLLTGYQSEYGRIRIEAGLNIVTIQDTPEIVERMLSVIKTIDVKPVDILFTVELIVGSFEAANVAGKKVSDKGLESDPLMKEMQRVMRFKTLNKIGSALMRVQDNKNSGQRIGGSGLEFRLELTPRYVREEKGDTFQVNLDLRHDRVIDFGGEKQTEKNVQLIATAFTLRSGEKTIVGVSKLDGGDKALILVISGKVIK